MDALDRDGGKVEGTVFHVKILNTVISANKAPSDVDDVASRHDPRNVGTPDGKSTDSLSVRKAQSSIFRVTGGLTYD